MSDKVQNSRFIKSVRLTYSDVNADRMDDIINTCAQTITDNGGKIVSYMEEIIGVGLATVYWVFVIVYEAAAPISDSAFKTEKRGKNNGSTNEKELDKGQNDRGTG